MRNNDIVASTRVRLARNLRGYPFPQKIKDEKIYDEIIDKVSQTFLENTDMLCVRIKELSALDRQRLVERHIISPELAKRSRGALVHTPDYKISIMINEEDHIRIQAVCDGLDVEKALMAASEVEAMLSEELMLAYDDELGYLTACPTNVGTGMRISAMVHLPALTYSSSMPEVINSVNRMGYTVRGVYGEGSDAIGDFYQISNEVTLGSTKAEIAQSFKKVIDSVCENEKRARQSIYKAGGVDIEDSIMRSLGALKYCRRISSKEAISQLSDVGLGISLGIIRKDIAEVYHAFWEIMPACLAIENEDAKARDMRRARYLNDLLKEV